MYSKDELKNLLLAYSILVNKLNNNQIRLKEFEKEYNNFYYVYALDGHESDEQEKEFLKEFKSAVYFHEKIQTHALDLLFYDIENREIYLKAGRLDEEQVLKRIKQISKECDLINIIEFLSS